MKGIIEPSAARFAEEETIKRRSLIKPSEILPLNLFLESKELFEEVAVESDFINL